VAARRKRKGEAALIVALACGASPESAAQKAGLGVRTVYRRLADPAFRAEVNEVRADTVRRAADMFSAASLPAIRTLMTLHESATSESVRLGAARALIELGCKLRENVELIARLAAGLGLAGAIPAALAAAERIMTPEQIAELDRTSPRDVLGQHKDDMAIPLADIGFSTLEPWSFFTGHGSHAGRWRMTLANGKKWNFQFVTTDQMQIAVAMLPELLKDKLQVRCRWDESRQQFVNAS
jgi:hypothetical protein